MADYKVLLGTQLDTKGIDAGINKYHQKKTLEFKSRLDTSGIDKKIASYKAKRPIEINAKLNTSGIAKKIGEYKPKTPVKINAELDTKNINTAIKAYKAKTPIKVDIKLDNSDISKQIRAYKTKTPIKVSTKLDSNDITKQIRAYQSNTPIKLSVKLTKKDIDDKIRAYKASAPIKLDVKINNKTISEQIKAFKPKNTIYLKAALQKGAIAEEIRKYKPNTPIKVDLELDYSDIDKKVGQYIATKGAVELPVKLKPSTKDFSSGITKTPIKVNAELNPDSIKNINGLIEGYQAKGKLKVGVKIDPKLVNSEIASIKPETPIIVKAKLDETAIDNAISSYQTKSPVINVAINVNNNDIDEELKKQEMQPTVHVNVKIDREKINEQIRNFTTKSRVKVGVKLDFVGISKQIKEYETKSKIKVGIELDKNSINDDIASLTVDTPIKLPVELDKSNVQSQIDDVRQQLEKLGNIKIDLIGVGNNSRNNVGGTNDTAGVVHKGIPTTNIAQNFKEANIVIEATDDAIKNLSLALTKIGFDKSTVESMTTEFKELGITVTNVTSKLNGDGSVRLTVKGLDDVKDAVTLIRNVGADGQLGSWSETISRDVNKVTENFNRLKSLTKDIGNLKVDIFKSNDADEVRRLTEELDKLQKEYDELFSSTQSGLKPNQINQLDNMVKNTETTLSNLKREYAETRAELEREIKIKLFNSDSGLSQFDNEIHDVTTEFSHLANKTPELQSAMNSLAAAFDKVKNASKNGTQDELIQANKEYEAVLKDVKTQLDINARAEREAAVAVKLADDRTAFQSKIDAWLTKNSAAAEQFGAQLLKLKAQAENCDRVTLDHLEREFKQIDKQAEAAGKKTKTFGDNLKTQFSKYSSYFSVASLFMWAGQAMRSMFEQVKLIDSAMTELKKVTNETDASYNRFLSNAASKAKELGTTIDGLVSSTADFARLGYGFEDAQGLAEVANIYAVVGDEIDGVEDATQSLVSTLAAFKHEMNGMDDSDFALSIVDKMNEVSNNFAISSGGIGQALQRSASSMAAANNTLDETIALITAANTVAQNPEKVGKGYADLKNGYIG